MADTLDLFEPAGLAEAVATVGADAMDWPEVLDEMTDYFLDEIARARPELDERGVRVLAQRLVARFVAERGGTSVYIPKPDALQRNLVRLQVWAQYDHTTDGPNGVRALARRYRLTEVTVYDYIRRGRARFVRRVQVDALEGL